MSTITRYDQITLSEIGERLAMIEKRYRDLRCQLEVHTSAIRGLDAERPDEDRRINTLAELAEPISAQLRAMERMHPWLLSEVR